MRRAVKLQDWASPTEEPSPTAAPRSTPSILDEPATRSQRPSPSPTAAPRTTQAPSILDVPAARQTPQPSPTAQAAATSQQPAQQAATSATGESDGWNQPYSVRELTKQEYEALPLLQRQAVDFNTNFINQLNSGSAAAGQLYSSDLISDDLLGKLTGQGPDGLDVVAKLQNGRSILDRVGATSAVFHDLTNPFAPALDGNGQPITYRALYDTFMSKDEAGQREMAEGIKADLLPEEYQDFFNYVNTIDLQGQNEGVN